MHVEVSCLSWDSHNKVLSRATCELHWSWDTLDALMRVSLCGIRLENMDWRATFQLRYNMRNRRFLVWTIYCKNFKLLYIYFWKNMIWSWILYERLRFSQLVIWKVVLTLSVTLKGTKKSKPSHEMKVHPSKWTIVFKLEESRNICFLNEAFDLYQKDVVDYSVPMLTFIFIVTCASQLYATSLCP